MAVHKAEAPMGSSPYRDTSPMDVSSLMENVDLMVALGGWIRALRS